MSKNPVIEIPFMSIKVFVIVRGSLTSFPYNWASDLGGKF